LVIRWSRFFFLKLTAFPGLACVPFTVFCPQEKELFLRFGQLFLVVLIPAFYFLCACFSHLSIPSSPELCFFFPVQRFRIDFFLSALYPQRPRRRTLCPALFFCVGLSLNPPRCFYLAGLSSLRFPTSAVTPNHPTPPPPPPHTPHPPPPHTTLLSFRFASETPLFFFSFFCRNLF